MDAAGNREMLARTENSSAAVKAGASEVVKNMGRTVGSFYGRRSRSRMWFFGGGCITWLVLGFFYVMFEMLKLSLLLAVELFLLAVLTVYGVSLAVITLRKRHYAKALRAQEAPAAAVAVTEPGPRDWTPNA